MSGGSDSCHFRTDCNGDVTVCFTTLSELTRCIICVLDPFGAVTVNLIHAEFVLWQLNSRHVDQHQSGVLFRLGEAKRLN